jgi:hypothetical protein
MTFRATRTDQRFALGTEWNPRLNSHSIDVRLI